jgi:hypothetical protein
MAQRLLAKVLAGPRLVTIYPYGYGTADDYPIETVAYLRAPAASHPTYRADDVISYQADDADYESSAEGAHLSIVDPIWDAVMGTIRAFTSDYYDGFAWWKLADGTANAVGTGGSGVDRTGYWAAWSDSSGSTVISPADVDSGATAFPEAITAVPFERVR